MSTQLHKLIFPLAMLMLSFCFTACKKNNASLMGKENDLSLMNNATNPASLKKQPKGTEFYALTSSNELVKYASGNPLAELGAVNITGLQTAEMIMAIDFRPATGQLYGISNQSRIYIINQNTGAAFAVSSRPFTPAINGTEVGFDFNPTVDRIRLVTNTGQNLRLNPETGTVAAADLAINPSGAIVTAVAYTNSMAGAGTTTLYDIDVASDQLYIQNPPNNGTLVPVGRQ